MTMRALSEMPEDSPSFEELEGHGQGQPSDVANMVLYLASDEARHVNGASMVIDNGETA
jgi:3(or 17)beta-hydroxysteroid dehydrogenase